jgi:hypothetical protein
MKKVIGDFLSLFFDDGDENSVPTKAHNQFFIVLFVMMIILIFASTI